MERSIKDASAPNYFNRYIFTLYANTNQFWGRADYATPFRAVFVPPPVRGIVRFGDSLITADNARRGIIALITYTTKRGFCAMLTLSPLTQNPRCCAMPLISHPSPLRLRPLPRVCGAVGFAPHTLSRGDCRLIRECTTIEKTNQAKEDLQTIKTFKRFGWVYTHPCACLSWYVVHIICAYSPFHGGQCPPWSGFRIAQ